jgi:Zn-dependent peptidase ImmA (M78 family)
MRSFLQPTKDAWMPTSVIVFGRKIPIKYITSKQLSKFIINAEGIWDTYTRTIYINKEAPVAVQKYYIYHEMGHAVMTFVGLDQIIQAEMQEIIVQSFATMQEEFIKQASLFK